jgi:hypothetical protein
MMMALAGALRIRSAASDMNIDQDKGLAHCRYIRLLASEIWTKENSGPSGKTMSWTEAIKHAMALHVKKLQHSRMTIKKLALPPAPPIIPPSRNIPTGYSGHGW